MTRTEDVFEKDPKNDIMQLIKIDFQYMAVLGLIYTLFPYDFSRYNLTESIMLIPVIILFFSSLLSIIILTMRYFRLNKIKKSTLVLFYRVLFAKISVSIIGFIGIISPENYISFRIWFSVIEYFMLSIFVIFFLKNDIWPLVKNKELWKKRVSKIWSNLKSVFLFIFLLCSEGYTIEVSEK